MSHTLYEWSGWFEISDLYTIKTVGDTATLSDSFAKSVVTWKEIRSVSDTATLSESFLKDTSDYWKLIRAVSQSATLADSFGKRVGTWLYPSTLTDSATIAESFDYDDPLYTYRTNRSVSDSATLAESFSKSTDYWKLIRSLSDSVTLSDSFVKATDYWRHIHTLSDSATLAESFAKDSPLHQWLYPATLSDSLSLSEDFDYDDPLYTYRTDRSLSQSASLSDSFSKSLDYWHLPRTLSDTYTLAEAFAKSTYTYRTDRVVSDSGTLADSFPTPTIDTWHHKIAMSMSSTLSESFAKSIQLYRQVRTISDSISMGESYASLVSYWINVRNISDSITASESFDKEIQYWRSVRSVSTSATLSDSFTVQMVVDNDTYYYDTISLSNATTTQGYTSSGNFTSTGGLVTNIEGLTDGYTNTPANYTGNTLAGVRYDLGSQTEIDFICVHLKSGMTDNIRLYGSNSQGSGYALISSPITGQASWTVNEFPSSVNYRYYVFQLEANTIDSYVDEIIMGMKFKPEIHEDMGELRGYEAMITKNESFKGDEYTFQRGDRKTTFDKKYGNISATLKTNFEDLRNKSRARKFVYYFDGIHYVSLEPVSFTEVSHNRYSTGIRMTT